MAVRGDFRRPSAGRLSGRLWGVWRGRRHPFIESFNGKLRDELLDSEIFETLLEAQMLAEDFRIDYNTYRPHSSLGYLAPAKFAEQWLVRKAGLSELVDS